MFKWVTTSFINGANYVDGKSAWLTGTNADGSKFLSLNHGVKFNKDNVKTITKAKWVDPVKDKMEIDLTDAGLTAGNHRLYIYIRSIGDADPLYSNDFIYKGRPVQVEFTLKASDNTAAKQAEVVKKAANKWITLLFGDSNILKISNNGSKVVIDTMTEYQRLHLVEIQKFDPEALVWAHDGAFVTLLSSDKDSENYKNGIFVHTKGRQGFGTYTQLIKDLRLPTNANLRLYADQRDEIPTINGKYWLYVITQCVERPEMQGTSVLGQYNQSVTTHVIFVEDGVLSLFDAAVSSTLKAATIIPEKNTSEPSGLSETDESVTD